MRRKHVCSVLLEALMDSILKKKFAINKKPDLYEETDAFDKVLNKNARYSFRKNFHTTSETAF